MVTTKEELKHYLKTEKKIYLSDSFFGRLEQIVTYDVKRLIFRFLKYSRRESYHHNSSGIFHKIMYAYCRRKKDKLGIRLGIEMWDNSFEEGLNICHAGNIVVNGKARIGKNCWLHGSNCIGNNAKSSECPVIGDNVHLGVGAKVIGNVTLADDIMVAAGAIVVDSFTEKGITIAGVPAKKVH